MIGQSNRGAPTKYKPEYCQRIIEFFSGDPYQRFPDENGKPTYLPPKLPTIERFADSLSVHKDTIYEWAKRHTDFSDALKIAQQKGKIFLDDAGLAAIYDRGYTTLIRNSLSDGLPNIHNCKTLRNKIKKIQEHYASGNINHIQSDKLLEQVRAEAQIIELSDIDERLRKIEKSRESDH